ncbi:glycoside hydrolase 5 family protein [Halegenticoccus soli]|uniref:glycoside hydrolase n=1 Tax=Halegenticoccus soli TaxID=1985678 RepID=UPI001179A158|nr:glycoside hydrolase [Halegenticoccus soli]
MSSAHSLADSRSLSGVRGAVYVPARAFNAYQLWERYDTAEVERDLGYASTLNLNAVRLFLSYERWRDDPEGLEASFDHLLEAAASNGIRVLPILFESAGREPTRDHLADRDPETACAVCSPSHDVIGDERRWSGAGGGMFDAARRALGLGRGGERDGRDGSAPRQYVEWFVGRYDADDRLLALEIMNEPGGWPKRVNFARRMLRVADDLREDLPLTMGCKALRFNEDYDDPELDAFQFHHNLPPDAADVREKLADARRFADRRGKPVWLTEWQRTRKRPPHPMLPNYASLAETIRGGDVDGDFLWSLMLKPAYLPNQRRKGRLNGLFHEDGAVWSAADARAVAGDPDLEIDERREPPRWLPEGLTRAG